MVPPSVAGVLTALQHLAKVLVQDALELAPLFPDHPVHVWLSQQEEFVSLLATYKEDKVTKVNLASRPSTSPTTYIIHCL